MAQVRVKRGKVDFLMDLSNISMTGALVDMGSLRIPTWVKEGRVVEIGIIHPVDLDTTNFQGRIVRVQKVGGTTRFGVQFIELDDKALDGLERLHQVAVGAERPAASEPPPSQPRVRKLPPPLPR